MRPSAALALALIVALNLPAIVRADDAADDDSDDDSPGEQATSPETPSAAANRLGLFYDTLRRSRAQPGALEAFASGYGDFKTRMEEEHGLTWSLSLSYRPRWVRPEVVGTTSQTLFWPSLNWDMFQSDTYGAGSFQFLYYGERKTGSTLKLTAGSRPLNVELPDYQNRFAQVTYTHALPGDKVSVAIGRYSFFNFDSSEFMADQQLNFVSGQFSANGSSSYPTSGIGSYVQFNATKQLQFLAGIQGFNADDTALRPTGKFSGAPHARLGYVQWTPALPGLGPAQYSLTLYQVDTTDQNPASNGWSINAVQHLDERWALFGRLNASHDDSGASKQSWGIGFALSNPLGDNPADQFAVAVGRIEQTAPFLLGTLQAAQETLEAYWNWSVLPGVLLSPDAQLIRHPVFAPGHDNAWIFSLRTTLVF